jgi:hypothetical protein
LSLDGICLGASETDHGWEATNPNSFDVTAEWRVNGSLLTGLLSIPAGSTVQFTTPRTEGDIAQLYYGGLFQDDAGAAVSCEEVVTPPDLPPGSTQQVLPMIPAVSETPVLIPVTGLAEDLGSMLPGGSFSLGLGFLGLGTILHGLSIRRKKQE